MIWVSAALTMIHLQSLMAFGFSHPDNPDASSCYPRDSCGPFRNEEQDHLWGNYTCECGRHCVRYGTCCADSPHAGTTLHVEHRGETCGRTTPYFSDYFIMVARCSDRGRHDYRARDACEGRGDAEEEEEDPLSLAPVTSAATGVTYRNRFCAACHFDSRDVRVWDAVLVHDEEDPDDFSNVTRDHVLRNLAFDKGRHSWGVSANGGQSFLKLRLLFGVPPALKKVVKKCYPAIVSDCDASHASDVGLRYRCLSYYSPVTAKATGGKRRAVRKYRNVHCAVCNGVPSAEDFACGGDVQRRRRPSFSFAHLIDLNGDVAGGNGRCGARQMWDPFSKKCRSLACALPGYVIRDGKCVES